MAPPLPTSPRDAPSCDLVVLGGGPAGLAAAWWAARRGLSVVVCERSGVMGGLAGRLTVGGVCVDLGSHRLHAAMPPHIRRELTELLGDDLQIRPRRGRVRLFDRWLRFPLQPTDLVRNLPLTVSARVAADVVAAPRRARRVATDGTGDGVRGPTFADVVAAKVGPTVSAAFYAPYAAKVWGVPADELAGEVARRRIGTTTPSALLGRVVAGTRRGNRTFLYPRLGFGQITTALADAATTAGARLAPGAEVARVVWPEDGDAPTPGSSAPTRVRGAPPARTRGPITVMTADGRTFRAATVFSTLPVATLCAVADPPPSAPVLAAARALESRAMVLVYLVVDRDRYTSFDAHYLPGSGSPVSRLSEPKNYRNGPDAAGRTVLCAEIPAWPGDDLWTRDDADLARLVADALSDLGLPAVHPAGHQVVRIGAVYPVLRSRTEPAWRTVQQQLHRWSSAGRMVSFGRQGLHTHDNTHHALAMAWEAVACLDRTGRFDGHAWATALARFDDHVVED